MFIWVSDLGSIWWKAGPFWLPGPVGSSQCHPQANTGEAPGRGWAQWRRIRLGHQLIWDRPRQPGQLPPLTPWTVQESEVRPRTKVKGNIFCFIWSEGGKRNHRECNIYSTIKKDRLDSCFRSTNVAERWNVILSQHLKTSSTSQMLGNLDRSSTFMLSTDARSDSKIEADCPNVWWMMDSAAIICFGINTRVPRYKSSLQKIRNPNQGFKG